MPTISEVRQQYPQYSDMSDADLAGALHQKFYADMPREEFNKKVGLQDKYQQAAIEDRDRLKASGAPDQSPYLRQALQGATFGAADELLAGARTPAEMVRHGTLNPAEGYRYAKARENLTLEDARKNTGALGAATEIGGGVASGGGLAEAGLTLARPAMGFVGRTLASAGEGAGYGGLTGLLDGGDGVSDRMYGAGKGILSGAIGGALLPAAMSGVGALASPIISNIRARINPAGVAESQLSRALMESGRPASEVEREIAQAHQEGQGAYTTADALGNAGQRMLSGVTRAPGPGRQQAVEFLENRQSGQGERLSDAIDTGLGTGPTARQTGRALIGQARTNSAPLYDEAINNSGPVHSERLQQFFDDPITQRGLGEGMRVQRLEALANGEHFNPNDYAITGFNEAGDPIVSGVPNMRTINLVKKGWDNILEGYRDPVTRRLNLDEYGRALDSVRRSFLTEVDGINPTYGAARAAYAGPAQINEAVGIGQRMAARGRPADTIEQFNGLNTPQQQGARSGYADALMGKMENSAPGVDKSRPLTTPKRQAELTALSLHNGPYRPGEVDPLQRQIARERTMFETRRQATGGSQTTDNLADAEALKVDPSLLLHLAHGNVAGAVGHGVRMAAHGLTGNTPEVRAELARLLLARGPSVDLAPVVNRVQASAARRQELAHALRSGLVTGSGEYAGQRK